MFGLFRLCNVKDRSSSSVQFRSVQFNVYNSVDRTQPYIDEMNEDTNLG